MQRIGDHVVGKLGLLVEGRQAQVHARRPEQAAVEHDIARNFADALIAQLGQQRPQLRQAQLGVGTATQRQVAAQDVALQRCGAQHFGEAAVGDAQVIERDHAGQQFHRRRRLHRLVGLVQPARAEPGQLARARSRRRQSGQDDHGQGVQRHIGLTQGSLHLGRPALGRHSLRQCGPGPEHQRDGGDSSRPGLQVSAVFHASSLRLNPVEACIRLRV